MLAGLTLSTSAPKARSAFTFSSATSSGIITAKSVNSLIILNRTRTNLHHTLYSARLSVECAENIWSSPRSCNCRDWNPRWTNGAFENPWTSIRTQNTNSLGIFDHCHGTLATFWSVIKQIWPTSERYAVLDAASGIEILKAMRLSLQQCRGTYLCFSQNLNAQGIAEGIYSN